MEITRIKNVKDFPIVEQSEISEVLAYDAEGNLIRAKYDESEVDIDLSDYYNKSETDDIVDKLEKDIADASAALLGSQSNPYYETIRGAVAIGQAAQNTADVNSEDIRQLNDSVGSIYSSLNQWKNDTKESLVSELEDWVSETDTLAKEAKTTADNAQKYAMAAQAAADVNSEDIRKLNEWADIAQTTIDAAWATAKDSNEMATAAQTTANNAQNSATAAQTTADNAQNYAMAAQNAADANAADIDVLETTVDYHSESIRTINATIGDINNILSNL